MVILKIFIQFFIFDNKNISLLVIILFITNRPKKSKEHFMLKKYYTFFHYCWLVVSNQHK